MSGAAALVREWYVGQGVISPSAALVRATLIHGADDLSPGQYGPAVTGTLVISDDVEVCRGFEIDDLTVFKKTCKSAKTTPLSRSMVELW